MNTALALMLAGGLAMAACTSNQETSERRDWVQVPLSQVIETFDQVCLGSAPDFVGAADRIARQGLTEPGLNNTFFLPGGGLSAKIATLPTSRGVARERCSVVFNAEDAVETQASAAKAVDAALASRGLALDSPPTDARVGQRTVRLWMLTIDGRPVRLSLLASLGPRIPAALFLDVTAAQGSA